MGERIWFYGRWLPFDAKVVKEFVFVTVIAARICQKARINPREAFNHARAAYFFWKEGSGCKEYGDPRFTWDVRGAVDLADTEMEEWEATDGE